MGLMQLMPATYEELRDRYSLGGDPFDPHNNLLAGTAYIRELSDRYGAPGFLAAYNAGPGRLDRYLAGTSSLPTETVNYVAAISPNLGNSVPMSGPLASYAVGRRPRAVPPTIASLAAGCDPDAAYDPDHPCRPLEVAAAAPVRATGAGGCDLDAAYDPSHPCRPASGQVVATQLAPPRTPQPVPVSGTAGEWAIQVGAFSTPDLAKAVAESARAQAPTQLGAALVSWPPTSINGSTLYRARLINLSANAAAAACSVLNQRQLPCIVVQPAA